MPGELEPKGIRITIPQALVIAVVLGILGWGWSVERRMTSVESKGDLATRIEHLENAMLPVLVDYRVKEELAKRAPEAAVKPPEVVKEAEKWAEDQIPNIHQNRMKR